MRYIGSAVTDTGIYRKTNQDSVCIKIAESKHRGQVAMAIVCDGMGGYEKGELASAEVIRTFSSWFEKQLPKIVCHCTWLQLQTQWKKLLNDSNKKILQFGQKNNLSLGTTFSAILCIENEYMIMHVGDTRIYSINTRMRQLTDDHTVTARKVRNGEISLKEAENDRQSHVLTQCIGHSLNMEPQILYGEILEDTLFLLCSDGFRHVIKENEIFEKFRVEQMDCIDTMEAKERECIELIKQRKEKDNITVALLKCMR